MKKRKKSLWITTLLSSAILALGAGVGIMATADEGEKTPPATLQERAAIGETVEIPEYFVDDNGVSVKAAVQIVTPSGETYVGTKFVASEAGKYIVQYLVDGKIVGVVLGRVFCGTRNGYDDCYLDLPNSPEEYGRHLIILWADGCVIGENQTTYADHSGRDFTDSSIEYKLVTAEGKETERHMWWS